MVQLRRTGKVQEVAEVAPGDCPRGHRRMAPTWAQCPTASCRAMVRLWRCFEDGCGHTEVDPDHVHKVAAPGMHRGG